LVGFAVGQHCNQRYFVESDLTRVLVQLHVHLLAGLDLDFPWFDVKQLFVDVGFDFLGLTSGTVVHVGFNLAGLIGEFD